MGFFWKTRTGTFKATDSTGRHFSWVISKFSSYKLDSTLDSENCVSFSKAKFHFHITLGTNGSVGFYIHYKSPPIPKYSYYFENSKEEVLRQHTAHAIPTDKERCGHWNVCNRNDMLDFLGEDDTLTVRICFDTDHISVKHAPDSSTTSVTWTIPNLREQNLNPYSSPGFTIDNALLVMRLDIKRRASCSIGKAKHDKEIESFIFFLFCRKGNVPPYSIELLDATMKPFVKSEKRADGKAQTLTVAKDVVYKHLGPNGFLLVQVDLETRGNPLEALNFLGDTAAEAPKKPTLTLRKPQTSAAAAADGGNTNDNHHMNARLTAVPPSKSHQATSD